MLKWTFLVVGLAAAVALAGLRGLAADTGSTGVPTIGLSESDDNPARRDDLVDDLSVEIDDDQGPSGDPDATGDGVSLDALSVATGGQASVGAAPASIDSPSANTASIQMVNPTPQSIDSLESAGASVDAFDSASAGGDFDSISNGASSG